MWPIALHSRWSNLSSVDINQRKAIGVLFFKLQLDFEQFYQKEIVKFKTTKFKVNYSFK